MHFSVHVIIPPGPISVAAAEPLVSAAMAPFDENLEIELVPDAEYGDYWHNPDSFWDWWQIGGRWKGALVPGYDANEDPAHKERCKLCDGTGTRPDGIERFGEEWAKNCNGCNGCNGTGEATMWPAQWGPHEGDVTTVASLLANLIVDDPVDSPYYLVMGGQCYETSTGGWSKDEEERKRLRIQGAIAYRDLLNEALASGTINIDDRVVVVDCHS